MEFKIDVFATSPSFDELEHCRKADLLIIGKFSDIDLPSVLRIAEILKVLGDMLVERGVLPDPAAGVALGEVGATVGAARADAPAPGIECSVCVQAGMSTGDLRLTLHIREVESWNKDLELEATHLRLKTLELERRQPAAAASPLLARQPSDPASGGFDVSRHIALVPPFRESEVDSYFNAFERIAALLSWPKDVWSLLLQCKLVGKAQEVCASLSIEQSLNYDVVKATVLHAYELIPGAYMQKFRN